MFDDGPALELTGLDDGTPGDEPDETGAEPFGKLRDNGVLERFVAVAVADDAGEARVAAPREALDRPCDVVCRVDAHEAAGADEVDLLCKPLADGHGYFLNSMYLVKYVLLTGYYCMTIKDNHDGK